MFYVKRLRRVSTETDGPAESKQNLSAGICPSSFFQTTTGCGVPETSHSNWTSEFCATTLSRGALTNTGFCSTAHKHTLSLLGGLRSDSSNNSCLVCVIHTGPNNAAVYRRSDWKRGSGKRGTRMGNARAIDYDRLMLCLP